MAFVSPSKESLLQSIRPDMKLTKDFFRRIYGYEISFPGFADQAVAALEAAGCGRARGYYQTWVSEYQIRRDADLKPVAAWYAAELERKWDSKQKEGEKIRSQKIQSLTRKELTELCQRLLKEGIITEPEQFVTVALQDH